MRKGFLGRLKDHLLGRLLGESYDSGEQTYDQTQRSTVTFVNDVMWSHLTMQVNYTTYDLRRQTDTLNVKKNWDVMIRSCEDDHPYWYCRIIGIYHVMVRHLGAASKNTRPQRMDFLHVHFFARTTRREGGWEKRRLIELAFDAPEYAFAFLDPALVIRAVHIIPAFRHGEDNEPLQSRLAHPLAGEVDFNLYYLNW